MSVEQSKSLETDSEAAMSPHTLGCRRQPPSPIPRTTDLGTQKMANPRATDPGTQKKSTPRITDLGTQKTSNSRATDPGTQKMATPRVTDPGTQKKSTPRATYRATYLGTQKMATPRATEPGTQKTSTPRATEPGTQKTSTPRDTDPGTQKTSTPRATDIGTQKMATPRATDTDTTRRLTLGGRMRIQSVGPPGKITEEDCPLSISWTPMGTYVIPGRSTCAREMVNPQLLFPPLDMTTGRMSMSCGATSKPLSRGGTGRLKVNVRVKPGQQDSSPYWDASVVTLRPPPAAVGSNKTQSNPNKESSFRFQFDKVLGPSTSQEQLFQDTALLMMGEFVGGKNCLLFTHGTSGSGKTYTMLGNKGTSGSGKTYTMLGNKETSGSGKTYTMLGTEDQPGLIPRALNFLFSSFNDRISKDDKYRLVGSNFTRINPKFPSTRVECRAGILERTSLCKNVKSSPRPPKTSVDLVQDSADTEDFVSTPSRNMDLQDKSSPTRLNLEGVKFSVFLSFSSIYDEGAFDLLGPSSSPKINQNKDEKGTMLKIALDHNGGAYVKGLSQVCVISGEEAQQVFLHGQKRLHALSCSSHSIFTIKLARHVNNVTSSKAKINTFTFCDMVGCRSCNMAGYVKKEAYSIDNSLRVLWKCINTLRSNQQKSKAKSVVPFQDSKLTQLLREPLLGNSLVTMIVTADLDPSVFDETLSVLRSANMAKEVIVPSVQQTLTNLTGLYLIKGRTEQARGVTVTKSSLDGYKVTNNPRLDKSKARRTMGSAFLNLKSSTASTKSKLIRKDCGFLTRTNRNYDGAVPNGTSVFSCTSTLTIKDLFYQHLGPVLSAPRTCSISTYDLFYQHLVPVSPSQSETCPQEHLTMVSVASQDVLTNIDRRTQLNLEETLTSNVTLPDCQNISDLFELEYEDNSVTLQDLFDSSFEPATNTTSLSCSSLKSETHRDSAHRIKLLAKQLEMSEITTQDEPEVCRDYKHQQIEIEDEVKMLDAKNMFINNKINIPREQLKAILNKIIEFEICSQCQNCVAKPGLSPLQKEDRLFVKVDADNRQPSNLTHQTGDQPEPSQHSNTDPCCEIDDGDALKPENRKIDELTLKIGELTIKELSKYLRVPGTQPGESKPSLNTSVGVHLGITRALLTGKLRQGGASQSNETDELGSGKPLAAKPRSLAANIINTKVTSKSRKVSGALMNVPKSRRAPGAIQRYNSADHLRADKIKSVLNKLSIKQLLCEVDMYGLNRTANCNTLRERLVKYLHRIKASNRIIQFYTGKGPHRCPVPKKELLRMCKAYNIETVASANEMRSKLCKLFIKMEDTQASKFKPPRSSSPLLDTLSDVGPTVSIKNTCSGSSVPRGTSRGSCHKHTSLSDADRRLFRSRSEGSRSLSVPPRQHDPVPLAEATGKENIPQVRRQANSREHFAELVCKVNKLNLVSIKPGLVSPLPPIR
uniref:Kinesin motor domain-containing protein n=1 Tax=Timema tahoe TaxID=61484 RepID=A0A7R9IG84_9NEOP|nr:unnamed protein product [Timema tahoe]